MKKLYQHNINESLIIEGVLMGDKIRGEVVSKNRSYEIGFYTDNWYAPNFHDVTDEIIFAKQKSKVYEIF